MAPSRVLKVARTSSRPNPSGQTSSQSALAPTIVPLIRSPSILPPVTLAITRLPNGPGPTSSSTRSAVYSNSGTSLGMMHSLVTQHHNSRVCRSEPECVQIVWRRSILGYSLPPLALEGTVGAMGAVERVELGHVLG